MPSLTSLAGQIAQAALIGPALARMKRRATRSLVGGAIVAGLAALGIAYLLIALRTELERQIGRIWAPVAIGGALCVLAGIAYLAFFRPRRARAAAADAQASAVRDEIVRQAQKVESQVASNPWQSVALAAAVGFAAAILMRSPRRSRSGPGASAERRGDGADESTPPPWAREFLRESERRRANGGGA